MILDNFPNVLWINLEKSIARRNYMEELLNLYQLKHVRIPAVDGTNYYNVELSAICKKNPKIWPAENACTCSHLKALTYFVEKMSDEKVIIFEDDVSFDFLPLIPYNWSDFETHLPTYNVVQLAISSKKNVENCLMETHPESGYYCTTAYLITRTAAIQILDNYFSKKINKFDLSKHKWATADSALYSLPNTYRLPIFTYTAQDSTIHSLCLKEHFVSKEQQRRTWENALQI